MQVSRPVRWQSENVQWSIGSKEAMTCTVAIYSINRHACIPWSANVQWTFHMSIGHFKCPLDPMDHWTLPIINKSTMPFPGGYKVRFSPLDPIDTQTSNGRHSICPLGIGHAHFQWTCELSIGSNGQPYVQWTFHMFIEHLR
jgi:hypothetical protein